MSNDTIMNGAYTNGTYWIPHPKHAPAAPYWRQRMELITVCVCNSLTLIVIVARIWYRWAKQKHFRYDDWWIAVAGFFLIPYWASQIGTSVYGSGLHDANASTNDLRMHWHFTPGWAGYYVVASFIKLSVCSCFLEILPHHIKKMRYCVFALCVLITALGITMTFSWLFECTPFLSNFLWSIESDKCINYDIFRWLWIGISLPIDIAILIVPARLLRKVPLREHERRILKLVFGATFLGTATCAIGIYGVYETRTDVQLDGYYQETAFIMMNDIEILMYALGASFPVFSRYLVNKAAPAGGSDSPTIITPHMRTVQSPPKAWFGFMRKSSPGNESHTGSYFSVKTLQDSGAFMSTRGSGKEYGDELDSLKFITETKGVPEPGFRTQWIDTPQESDNEHNDIEKGQTGFHL